MGYTQPLVFSVTEIEFLISYIKLERNVKINTEIIMNALAVQNPRHKCDLGINLRMIQSRQGNNCRQYLTVIIIITLIILSAVLNSSLSFNHMNEMNGWS